MTNKLYADRDCEAMASHYTAHVSAMTGEGLHYKSDIAAELAHRDVVIEGLLEALKALHARYVQFIGNEGPEALAAIAKAGGEA